MDSADLIALVTGLLAPEPDAIFDVLRSGGSNRAYPVVVEQCESDTLGMEIEGQTVICGTVGVPENHDAPNAGNLAIEFAILRAQSEAPFSDPVVYLHGGPGEGTLASLTRVAGMFAEHRRTRDIVSFDQRASGLTARNLRCVDSLSQNAELVGTLPETDSTGPDEAIVALTAACVAELEERGVDLSLYNTVMNARDVRAVVQGLGYEDYNIYGISYGTRLALEVMRTDPEGLRSVTLDSVAPSTVRLYDELLGPHQDMLDAIVGQCADNPDCAEAYPDFGEQISQVVADLRQNPISGGRGTVEVTADLYVPLLQGRNLAGLFGDVTAYLPRITSELARRETAALDRYIALAEEDRISPMRRIFRATVDLDPDEQALAIAAFQAADLIDAAEELAIGAVTQLESDLRGTSSVAGEFSIGLEAAFDAMPNVGARTAMLSNLLALQDGAQTRERLRQLISDHLSPTDEARLSNLVNAMTEKELSEAYTRIIERDDVIAGAFLTNFHQMTYACQEDVPWNSREGAAAFNETVRYPFLLKPANLRASETIYAACDAFDQRLPRPDFHEPVSSDLPVMVLSGLADTQTSWRWGPQAAETLTNAQVFVFPGAGHGAFQFSDCARDMTVAFIHAPGSPVPDGCIAGLEPDFLLPDEPMR